MCIGEKAENLVVLDVYNLTTLSDYFVNFSANLELQIKSICDRVSRKTSHKPGHVESDEKLSWVLLESIDVLVHVFSLIRQLLLTFKISLRLFTNFMVIVK